MSKPSKSKIPGPFIAVGCIALIWLGLQIWPLLNKEPETPSIPGLDSKPTKTDTAPQPNTKTVVSESYSTEQNTLWTTYHGGQTFQGLTQYKVPESPQQLWNYQADSEIYDTPVTDGKHIYFCSYKGTVYALDLQGNEVWTKTFHQEPYPDGRERLEYFDAPVTFAQDTLLVGALSGMFYALEPADGSIRWQYDTDGTIISAANYADPDPDTSDDEIALVLEQNEGVLLSFNLKSGDLVWKTTGIDRCDGPPTVIGDAAVHGSCAAALHIFQLREGTPIKDIELDIDSQVAGGAAIVGSSAFVGTYNGWVYNIDMNAGEVLWINKESYSEVFETPAINDDLVIVSSFDDMIYALDRKTGELVWKNELDGLPTSPVIAQNRIIVTIDGLLAILDLETGTILWQYEISDMASSPAVIQDMIVVGADDGTLTAFGSPTTDKE